MKLVNFRLIAWFVISYCVGLLLLTPVSWFLPYLDPQLNSQGISLRQASGNIWQGQAKVRTAWLADADLHWHFQPSGLLRLSWLSELRLTDQNLDLQGGLALSPFGLRLSAVNGYIDDSAARPFYAPYGVELSGRLQLSDVTADIGWGLQLGDAEGQATWSGGPIRIPVGRSVQQYEVPTLYAAINSDDQQWLARVTGMNEQNFIDATLSRTGLGTLVVKRSLAETMRIPLPAGGENLIEISQQVLNGS